MPLARRPVVGAAYGWFDLGELDAAPRGDVRLRHHLRERRQGRDARAPQAHLAVDGRDRRVPRSSGTASPCSRTRATATSTSISFAATVTLEPGKNRITGQGVRRRGGTPKFALRIGDERGAPDLGIEVPADLLAAATAPRPTRGEGDEAPLAKRPAPRLAAKSPRVRQGRGRRASRRAGGGRACPRPRRVAARFGIVLGPMQIFERQVSGREPAAAPRCSGGVRPLPRRHRRATASPERRARDLARRARRGRTHGMKRLLLAGTLSEEDRNQERDWSGRRRGALAGPGHRDVDVLFAEAQLARTGTNWRDAVPIFEKIREIDPDHIAATLGLTELYVEAGLKRTALATLEKATLRQPQKAWRSSASTPGSSASASGATPRPPRSRRATPPSASTTRALPPASRSSSRWPAATTPARSGGSIASSRASSESAWSRAHRRPAPTARLGRAGPRAARRLPAGALSGRARGHPHPARARRSPRRRGQARTEQSQAPAADPRASAPRPRTCASTSSTSSRPDPAPTRPTPGRPSASWPCAARPPSATPSAPCAASPWPPSSPTAWPAASARSSSSRSPTKAAAGAREYAFEYQAVADKQAVQLRAAKVYRAERQDRRRRRERRGQRQQPLPWPPTPRRAPSTSTSRASTPATWSSSATASTTLDRATRSRTTSASRSSTWAPTEPVASSEAVLITPKNRTFYANAQSVPGVHRETVEQGDQRIDRFLAERVPRARPSSR